jgi:hypothetical protein
MSVAVPAAEYLRVHHTGHILFPITIPPYREEPLLIGKNRQAHGRARQDTDPAQRENAGDGTMTA